jgi:hypothetical protein
MTSIAIFEGGCNRDTLLAFQASMENSDRKIDADAVCPVTHHFAPGLYAREIFMPAGVCVVGKIHKHAHVNNISKGRVLVTTEFGKEEFCAPYQFVSLPGTKRAVLVLEDCIWTTYHPTEETDLARIEGHVIAETYGDYERFCNPNLLDRVKNFFLR